MPGPELVWYAGYGSNLWWPRFRCYLEGGIPPGSKRSHAGARDPSAPLDDAACWLPHPLVFADASRTWGGGGVAYVDASVHVDGASRARRWLITAQQFSDVVAQEGGRQPGHDLDLAAAMQKGSMTVGSSWYDLVLVVDDLAGVPVVTLTTSRPVSELLLNRPSKAYAETIANGLKESHGLTEREVEMYLDAAAPAVSKDPGV